MTRSMSARPGGVKLRDNIDTDIIYPGRYLNITDREKTRRAPVRALVPGDSRPRAARRHHRGRQELRLRLEPRAGHRGGEVRRAWAR